MSEIKVSAEVCKRDGRLVSFDEQLIAKAVTKAFEADGQFANSSTGIVGAVLQVAERVATFFQQAPLEGDIPVESIQDQVEVALMSLGYYSVARKYILYRDGRAKARTLQDPSVSKSRLSVLDAAGLRTELSMSRIRLCIQFACRGLTDVSFEELLGEVSESLYDGMSVAEIEELMCLSARSRVEKEPEYDAVAVRLLLMQIERQALGKAVLEDNVAARDFQHRVHFKEYLQDGVASGQLDPQLLTFDLPTMMSALVPSRDFNFKFLGLQTIYDRYLKEIDGRRIETPQYFWMRVAMGLALGEENPEYWATRFYEMLSTFRFVSGTPTLFNSGTNHPQLSSCYLLQVEDSLDHILKINSDHGKLSKWAGGLGTSVTKIRATNAMIKSTQGPSQGVIPFIKMYDSTTIAVNQGGKRKGALCLYMEPWHLDVEDFIDLRRNTGDDRRRAHDTHTALWIPDLFMKRVRDKGVWTLFSPDETPDLCNTFGQEFEERYHHYEKMAESGMLKLSRQISAIELWRKIVSRLFETGHPWITFKDTSNVRSPQDHVGMIHSSNLCTEITLNTSEEESAVCNLGSINWSEHIQEITADYSTMASPEVDKVVVLKDIDKEKLEETVSVAIRMLDNVIDLNFYPIPESQTSNMRHRPIGLGQMGFQDMLMKMRIPYASLAAVALADVSSELYSYYAISASASLAQERGPYETYAGSKWSRGIFPVDTLEILTEERDEQVKVFAEGVQDWSKVREAVAQHGMRNSNVMAIAPTATIGFIAGVTASIEPFFKHLFVKSNLSGEFTCVNLYLVRELKKEGLWTQDIIDQIKYHDGSILSITEIPEEIRVRYLTAFEIDSTWLIQCAARRQKWIDQGQSLNLYTEAASGKKLTEMYFEAWESGLKTTYYLRTRAATQVEKSTLDVNKFGIQPAWMKNKSASADITVDRAEDGSTCRIDDPECEACQ